MLVLTPPRADHRRTSDFPHDRRRGWLTPVGNLPMAPMISAPDSMVVENSDPIAVVGYPLSGALAYWIPAGRGAGLVDLFT
jgi:hypothetical protein